tara:strand:- start:23 stop:589 length:567 start_codon:yes stop_codon:yes gene_type:complete
MPTTNFNINNYSSLPYLNIDADAEPKKRTLKLSELFEYQKLTIPAAATTPPPPSTTAAPTPGAPTPSDLEYHILNIKKQFICVKFKEAGNEQSRIYVKNPVIDETLKDKLPLISISNKTILGEIVFNENGEPTANSTKDEDMTGLEIFNKVYEKIGVDKKPYFAEGPKSFQGGNKRGGTRKLGGSRSR